MIILSFGALLLGVLSAMFLFPGEVSAALAPGSKVALCALMLFVGVDIGHNRAVFRSLRRRGLRVLLVPLSVLAGTLLAGTAAGALCGYNPATAAAISSGLGWYSLSAVMLTDAVSPQVGTVALLSNIFRELIAFLSVRMLAKYVHPYAAIAPAGACAMDTALPFIKRAAGEEVAVVSVVTGVILSSLVPVFVTLFAGLA